MATIYGESLSPLMREIEIMTLESESAYNKIEAMEAMYESLNTSRYMEAEARVLYENGTDEDLYHYYMEAEEEKTNQSGGIVMSIINWFKTQIGKFGNWLAQVCGANNSRMDQLAGQQVEYNKADETLFGTLKTKWGSIVKSINKACQQLEQNAPVASIVVPTLASFGLGFLEGGGLSALLEKGETVTADGSKGKEHAATIEEVNNDCNKLIKRLETLSVKFQNMVNSGVQKVNTKWTVAGDAVVDKAVAKQEAKNQKQTTETPTKESVDMEDFDDVWGLITEKGKNRGKNSRNNKPQNNPANPQTAASGNPAQPAQPDTTTNQNQNQQNNQKNPQATATTLEQNQNPQTTTASTGTSGQAQNQQPAAGNDQQANPQNQNTNSNGNVELTNARKGKIYNQSKKIVDTKNDLTAKGMSQDVVQKAVDNQIQKTVNTARKQKQAQKLDDAGISNAQKILVKIQQLLTFLKMILSATMTGAKDLFSKLCPWVNNNQDNPNANNGNANAGTGNAAPDNTGNTVDNGAGGGEQPQTDQNVGNASARDGLDIPGEVINEAKTVNMFGLSDEDMLESSYHSEDELDTAYEMMESIFEKF